MTTGDKDDLFEFDATGESAEYIGLIRARIVAIKHAQETPGNYGAILTDKRLVYELAEADEDDDYYHIKLFFRPAGSFEGTPGTEEFFVSKIGEVELRQILADPIFVEMPGSITSTDAEEESSVDPDQVLTEENTAVSDLEEQPVRAEETEEIYTAPPVVEERPVSLPQFVYQVPEHKTFSAVDKMLTGEICTIAGNGKKGSGGDGAPALNASLNEPYDVAIDAEGNIYIADSGNHRIRKVDVATGLIKTVAGNGKKGFQGDGGNPVQASMNEPRGIDFDANGNLYFSDRSNHRIRMVSHPDGVIKTIAGTGRSALTGDGYKATIGTLSKPESISIEKESGKIFIACQGITKGNKRIRVVDQEGIMGTFAGCDKGNKPEDGGLSIQAEFGQNDDLIVLACSSQNIIIGDQLSKYLYSVDCETGLISVVAGTGSTGNRDDGAPLDCHIRPQGLACKPGDSSSIFINDGGSVWLGNKVFRKFDLETNYIHTVAGNGKAGFDGDGGPAIDARFDKPRGMTVDSHGNLYIADTDNHRIRVVKGPL